MSNWEIVRVLATIGTLVVAVFAWRMAVRTYRASFRPVLRPVLLRHQNGDIAPEVLVLKNIGRGPAVSVFLVEPEPPPGQQWPPTHPGPVVTTVDVVEPLGGAQGAGEKSRIGRVQVAIPTARLLRRNTTYRLLYQDLLPRWHETTFSFDDQQQMTTQQRGALGWFAADALPADVKDRAQIVHDTE